MRRIWTRGFRTVLMLTAWLMHLSCTRDMHDAPSVSTPVEVGIYAGGTQTRTEMLSNGLSAQWTADDRLALWAMTSSGSYALINQVFKTYGIDSQFGFFTSVLDAEMPEGTYTYYCCYPVPASANGTQATFNIPAVQDGKVSGGADVMIATPTVHPALRPVPEPEDHSGMSLQMNRMMHQFRFWVPSDNTVLGDEKITKMILTFPSGVVGNVTYDISDPAVSPVVSDATGQITLNMAEPLAVSPSGEYQFACVALIPSSFNEGEKLQVKAYTADKIVGVDPIDLCARTFLAGHSTPVRLDVKSVEEYPYQIEYTLSGSNLGEDLNSIVFTAPSGCVWNESKSNVYTYTPGHKITAGEKVVFRFEDQEQYRAFGGQTIALTYDSDHALIQDSVVMGDTSSSDKISISSNVPYLFYEDFSGIPSFSDGHDDPNVGMKSDTYAGITELSSYTLPGWFATRIGGQANTSVRICCRYEDVMGGSAYYKGRLYTPFLSNLKDGASTSISVSFRYGSNIKEPSSILASPGANPLLYFGMNTEETVLNPDDESLINGVVTGSGYGSQAPSSLSPMPIRGEYLSISGGSYTSFEGTKTVTVDGVDNGMRLAWIVSTTNTKGSTNGNYWLYIDDIKVQINN